MKFDIQLLFSPKYAKWIIIGLITLFSMLIIYSYASLLFFKIGAASTQNSETNAVELPKQEDAKHFLKASLFGVYMPNDLNDDNVKESLLNVTLVGILYDENPENSQVIIRSSSGDEKTYVIGDKIPGGAVIKRIIPNGVLVERDGTLESLSLPKNELNFEPVAKPLKED
ncbi:type II secretion system protein N [Legionella waltersii]|uniref:General secretion pathway protein C n=1 Tax=Legionella waltersii TaxID=66969 RepID=A0A0W1ANS9_9GAMM|nr:type II secretion system protein N [Legionella waltersii]KTD82883.1 general secretion pathway protein C [Legionella waltersii]SNV02062.1 general secretion pathway protein C [Legionella waltersii]